MIDGNAETNRERKCGHWQSPMCLHWFLHTFTVKYLDGFMIGIVLWGVEIDILVTSSILNTHIST